ncbi:MAG: cytochrome c peroxidase [Deltaproteobacteria bacterium]
MGPVLWPVRSAPRDDARCNIDGVKHSEVALLILACGACRGIEPIEAPGPLDDVGAARVALGHRLFFDPVLSADDATPCAACHRPEAGGAEPRPVSEGVRGALGRRNAPSVLNASLKFAQFWDGREDELDAQALGPLYAEDEMGLDAERLVARLTSYRAEFARAFPSDAAPLTPKNVALALAAYERRLAWPGRIDRYLGGDEAALTAAERAGYDYFASNCAFCHDGPGIGGQRIERLGDRVPWPESRAQDRGRREVTNDEDDDLKFVVPSLRNVGRTAPYFHDGSVETLDEAVRLMAKHQLDTEMTDREVEEVVAFLEALNGEAPAELVEAP